MIHGRARRAHCGINYRVEIYKYFHILYCIFSMIPSDHLQQELYFKFRMFVDIMTLVDRRWELKDPAYYSILMKGDANKLLLTDKNCILDIFADINKHAKSKIQFFL